MYVIFKSKPFHYTVRNVQKREPGDLDECSRKQFEVKQVPAVVVAASNYQHRVAWASIDSNKTTYAPTLAAVTMRRPSHTSHQPNHIAHDGQARELLEFWAIAVQLQSKGRLLAQPIDEVHQLGHLVDDTSPLGHLCIIV